MKLARQIIRLIIFIIYTLFCATAQMIWAAFKPKDRYKFARLWHRGAIRIVGVHVRAAGTPASGKVVFLANHVSHLDISVFGGLTPVRFISKQEVQGWPVFGQLAKLQDTIFVDRTAKLSAIKASRATIQSALDRGERLIIFPEGTNTIGNVVLPFRRGMLDGLKAEGYALQPVVIECTSVDGHKPSTVEQFEVYGWGDISFALHFWRIMGYRRVDVTVSFLSSFPVASQIEGAQIERAGDLVRSQVEATYAS